MNPKKITVVGGGLVGSLCAVILSKKGHQVNVFERRPDIRKVKISAGRSINLALSDRGWRALEAGGVAEKIKSIAIPMPGRQVHNLNGEENFQPYGLEGQAINSVSRGAINQILLEEAGKSENVSLRFHARCTGVDTKEGITYFEDTETGEQFSNQADVIFGADGAFSALRYELQKTDRFDYNQIFLEHGYKELSMPANAEGKWKIKKQALHIWPRKRFMLIALPNTDGSFTCTLFLPFEGDVSFEKLQTKEDITTFFNTYFPDVLPLIPDLTEQFFANPTSSLVTVKCYPWVFENRVALIGDAAHAIVPFYGQGMNAGFEDCRVLNDLMDKYDDVEELLQAYQEERKPNGDAIADLAIRNFVEMRDKVADDEFLLRKKIEKILHEKFPDHYIPLYSMVTFSHIPYANALRTGILQDRFFEKVFKTLRLQNTFDETVVEELIHKWLAEFQEDSEKGYAQNRKV